MSETTREVLLARRPEGEPVESDFEVREADVPDPGPDEVLVRVSYLSVDPYMRGRMSTAESYADSWEVGEPMRARAVGEVVESNHSDHASGDHVFGTFDWAEHGVAPGDSLSPVDPDRAPLPAWLGVLGMPGRTAYFGMLDVAEPNPGDAVVVSGAAGAVGSVAGQLASLSGARVVGIAGTDGKCAWLTNDLGFDAAVNYETEDVRASVGDACPDGVDVYYDNVGGEVTDAVLAQLAVRARVAVCGQIALYNAEETPTGPRHLGKLVGKRARVEGFLVGDYENRYAEANERLARWVERGEIEHRETVTDGIENAPAAFIGLFEGSNVGKQVVAVAPE